MEWRREERKREKDLLEELIKQRNVAAEHVEKGGQKVQD